MKKILTTVLMIALASVVCAGIVFAQTSKGTVNASELNLRERASTSANALDVLYKGAKVNIITEEGDWYKVKYNNEEGYVSKQYITVETIGSTNTSSNSTQNTTNQNTEVNNVQSNITVNENLTNSANSVDNTTSNETSGSDNNQPVDVMQIKTANLKEEATMYVLPLISSTKIGKVNANTKVVLISVNGDWSYVQTETQNGWLLTKRLDIPNPTPASTTAPVDTTMQSNTTTTEPTSTETPESTSTPTPSPTATVTSTPEPTSTPPTTSSEYPTTMYVNVDAVNVRSQANTSSTVVTSVGKNVPITVEAKEGDWYRVKTSDGNGYIKGEFLSKNKQ